MNLFYPISARRYRHYHNVRTSTCRSTYLQRFLHSRLRLQESRYSLGSASAKLGEDDRTSPSQVKCVDRKGSIYSAPTLPRPFTNIMVPCLSSQVRSSAMDYWPSKSRNGLTTRPYSVPCFIPEMACRAITS